MLNFFQPRLSLRRHLPGGVDAHCHLLPGVDDGAASAEEALSIIRGQQALGLRGAICTPHIMARYPQNTPACLREQFAQFTSIVNSQSSIVNFRLHLAAEYMLDEAFPRHLASGDLLTIPASLICPTASGESSNSPCLGVESGAEPRLGAGNVNSQSTQQFLLVELPQYLLPPGWQDMLDSILAAGHTPLLAHPERYLRILEEGDLRALAERGIALQGNLGSLTGYYGSRVKSLAQSLHADGLYTTWGTDSHSYGMLRQLKLTA